MCMLCRDMASGAPLWLKLVLRAERGIGRPVEAAVRSDVYFDAVAEVNKAAARLSGALERASRRGWHLLNLPAGSDVRRMREQLGGMDRRIVRLTKELEALERRTGETWRSS
jgi:hypothetical protein